MAKRVIWSIRAKTDKKEILTYWFKKNKSYTYPKKLNNLLKVAVKSISDYPQPRRLTDFKGVYVKIVRDYKIFYAEDDQMIYILTIWDTRQNPNKLNKIID